MQAALESEEVLEAVNAVERLNRRNIITLAELRGLSWAEEARCLKRYEEWFSEMVSLKLPEGLRVENGVLCRPAVERRRGG